MITSRTITKMRIINQETGEVLVDTDNPENVFIDGVGYNRTAMDENGNKIMVDEITTDDLEDAPRFKLPDSVSFTCRIKE